MAVNKIYKLKMADAAKLDEIEKESNRDEIMEIELLEKYTVFMMRLMQTPSKIFNLSFGGNKDD